MSEDQGPSREDVREMIDSTVGSAYYAPARYLDVLRDLVPSPSWGVAIRPTVNMVVTLLLMYPFVLVSAVLGLWFFVPLWGIILAMATVITAPQHQDPRNVEFSSGIYLAVSVGLGALHVMVAAYLGLAGVAVVVLAIALMNWYWRWYARRHLA